MANSSAELMATDPTKDAEFKRVLGKLLSAPPKPHADMKVGKKKRASPKRKSRNAD
jgi:hypothetical protein